MFSQLGYLWLDDDPAIGLSRVLCVVVLVVVFGFVEVFERGYLGDDGSFPDFRFLEFLNNFPCSPLLFGAVLEDR